MPQLKNDIHTFVNCNWVDTQ